MASQSPTVEISADSLKPTQSRGFIKLDFDENLTDEELEFTDEVTLGAEKVESLLQIEECDSQVAAKSSTQINSPLPSESCSSPVVVKDKGHAVVTMQHHSRKEQPTQEECGRWSKPQLDKIFTRGERFGSSSSNLATDFSRALLQNLLQRGKEASLEFETSHAGTFSDTDTHEGVAPPSDASVEELATKIVQRINQVKESRCNYFHLNSIKCVFDKLIAASPSLGTHLQRLKDLYMQPTNETPPEPTSPPQAQSPQANPLTHDSIARIERLEEELKEQATLLYKLLAELESLKEQSVRLAENLSNEGETLAEMKTYKNLLLEEESGENISE